VNLEPWSFTGGLAPNRFQKSLGMRRETLKIQSFPKSSKGRFDGIGL
jgi:hypothetical protein